MVDIHLSVRRTEQKTNDKKRDPRGTKRQPEIRVKAKSLSSIEMTSIFSHVCPAFGLWDWVGMAPLMGPESRSCTFPLVRPVSRKAGK